MLGKTAFLTLVSLVSVANATFNTHVTLNWGCSSSQRDKTPVKEKNDCTERGSFLVSFGDKGVCSSSKTRIPPRGDDCPFNWGWHKWQNCCVPPKEVDECDCGYNFDKKSLKCKPPSNNCPPHQFWHIRTKKCCDKNWNPDEGSCPPGKRCPKGWFWSKKWKVCKPKTIRTPKPDCDDWDEGHQCCGGNQPNPSPKPKPPPHHGGGGNWPCPGGNCGGGGGGGGGNGGGHCPGGSCGGPCKNGNCNGGIGIGIGVGIGGGPGGGGNGHWKRRAGNIDLRNSLELQFEQSDFDRMYCPGSLHACTVNTPGDEWAYECIDPATELESCGGCASTGEGVDCTQIAHASSVGCERGVCAVYSCQAGFAVNGTSCAAI